MTAAPRRTAPLLARARGFSGVPLPKIEVTSRKVSGQRGKSYDAEGTHDSVEYSVIGASSRKAARDQARADIAFCTEQPSCEAHGFRLFPVRAGDFCMSFPGTRGSVIFGATSTGLALARLALDYHDHSEALEFVRAAVDALDRR